MKGVMAGRPERAGNPGKTRHPGAATMILKWGPRSSLRRVKYSPGAVMDFSPAQALSRMCTVGISHSSLLLCPKDRGCGNGSLGTSHLIPHSLKVCLTFGRASISLLSFSNKLVFLVKAQTEKINHFK